MAFNCVVESAHWDSGWGIIIPSPLLQAVMYGSHSLTLCYENFKS